MSDTIENDSTQSQGVRPPASVPRAGGAVGAGARASQALAALRARQPALLLACLLPALWLVAAAFLQHVREQAFADAGTDTGNLARVMAEETQSSVRAR